YDWSEIEERYRDANIFPVIPEAGLRATLGILDPPTTGSPTSLPPGPGRVRRAPRGPSRFAEPPNSTPLARHGGCIPERDYHS
ncbi:hypothetical protein ABZ906_31985, partial [Streptomyces sp. NPDC046925]